MSENDEEPPTIREMYEERDGRLAKVRFAFNVVFISAAISAMGILDELLPESQKGDRREFSSVLGVALLFLAGSFYASWYLYGAGWAWKFGVAGVYVAIGLLLLNPDIKLYEYGKAPIDEWLEADDDFEAGDRR